MPNVDYMNGVLGGAASARAPLSMWRSASSCSSPHIATYHGRVRHYGCKGVSSVSNMPTLTSRVCDLVRVDGPCLAVEAPPAGGEGPRSEFEHARSMCSYGSIPTVIHQQYFLVRFERVPGCDRSCLARILSLIHI